jgi:phosphoglycerate dehydrogenase-like enzyme
VALLDDLVPFWMLDAAVDGGAELVPLDRADTIVWGGGRVPPSRLAELVAAHGAHLDWVQLPWAGVEPYLDLLDDERIWTCAKGAYGDDVAEMALALLLAGLRGIGSYARASTWRGPGELGDNLLGADVCIVGGGGIAERLVQMLAPFGCRVTVVRRQETALPGADRVVTVDALDDVLPGADAVVLALALTPATEGLFDARRLGLMAPHAWLVNVARGAHVVTDDLVAALAQGALGGAALDVTDPEPLPDDHPLWREPRCIITPHVANTSSMLRPRLAERITENVRRRADGRPLLGVVDPATGY